MISSFVTIMIQLKGIIFPDLKFLLIKRQPNRTGKLKPENQAFFLAKKTEKSNPVY